MLVPERHLVRINSMDTMLGSLSMIAGPALGILLYTSFGLQSTIFLGFIGAAAAAVTMLLAKIPRDHGSHENMGAWASLKKGAFALADQRGLLVLVIGVSLGLLAYGPIDSLLPLMVYSHFGGDGFAASLLAAVMGIGLLAGSLILMVVNPQRKLARIIVVAASDPLRGLLAVRRVHRPFGHRLRLVQRPAHDASAKGYSRREARSRDGPLHRAQRSGHSSGYGARRHRRRDHGHADVLLHRRRLHHRARCGLGLLEERPRAGPRIQRAVLDMRRSPKRTAGQLATRPRL